jgi:uncharacterized OsmC-like protein
MSPNDPHDVRTVTLEHLEAFQFAADFGNSLPLMMLDEPLPLGNGAGPDAARLLAAAVGQCLSASLLLCLQKSRVTVHDLRTEAGVTIARNDRGRLRVTGVHVGITVEADDLTRLERCADVFEDYCIVTASVRRAFPVSVVIADRAGRTIYQSSDQAVAAP